jgi:hypothetical protein
MWAMPSDADHNVGDADEIQEAAAVSAAAISA